MRDASRVDRALGFMDSFWDPKTGLVGYPSTSGSSTNPLQQPGVPSVRETATYAVGLLARGEASDVARAERALGRVLEQQIDAPGTVVHGTWRRSPQEPNPGSEPREWIDYDPNWREFVGTSLLLALDAGAGRLSAALEARIDAALERAVWGTLARDVAPEYTNIALMCAFLLDRVGARLGREAWRSAGERLAESVRIAYLRDGAFPEHNSPTYYGTDLYGLALWRARAESPRLRAWGAELEAALWRDLARFYHAGLGNLCGPWSRAYGMDMTRYVAGLGLWIEAAAQGAVAPVPVLGDAMAHGHDYCGLVYVGLLGSQPPADVRPDLATFRGERRVEQVIKAAPPRRVATAWLDEHVMIGGEHTSARVIHWQQHPATLHWRRPDGHIGWLRLVTTAAADAVASPGRLDITVHTGARWLSGAHVPVWLEVHPDPGANARARDASTWQLPGLSLTLSATPSPEGLRTPGTTPDSHRLGWIFEPGSAPETLRLSLRVDPA